MVQPLLALAPGRAARSIRRGAMSEWTPKLRLKLTERWKAGASAAAIAAEFGMTRGQINGMIWRLGLKTNLPSGRPRARKAVRPRESEPKRGSTSAAPPFVPAPAAPVRTESQSDQECLPPRRRAPNAASSRRPSGDRCRFASALGRSAILATHLSISAARRRRRADRTATSTAPAHMSSSARVPTKIFRRHHEQGTRRRS